MRIFSGRPRTKGLLRLKRKLADFTIAGAWFVMTTSDSSRPTPCLETAVSITPGFIHHFRHRIVKLLFKSPNIAHRPLHQQSTERSQNIRKNIYSRKKSFFASINRKYPITMGRSRTRSKSPRRKHKSKKHKSRRDREYSRWVLRTFFSLMDS